MILLLLTTALAREFFVVSDLHLDIAYESTASISTGCHKDKGSQASRPQGRHGCDSPGELVRSTLKQMKLVEPYPEFIIVTGDIVAHETYDLLAPDGRVDKSFNKRLVKETYDKVATLFKEFFPKTQVIIAYGNNDGYGDYSVPSDADALGYWSDVLQVYSRLNPDISISFLEGGFYSTRTATGLPVICLNTNFFSIRTRSDESSRKSQFDFLAQFLRNASQPALIAMHIPPGVGKYRGSLNWHPEDIEVFCGIINSHSESVKLILAGHLHSQTFQLITQQTPVVVHSSVSPIFGNNPMFRIYSDTEGKLEFVDYSFDLYSDKPTWAPEYFSSLYSDSNGYFTTLFGLLNNTSEVKYSYMRNALGASRSGLADSVVAQLYLGADDDRFKIWKCSMAWVLPMDYARCLAGNN